MATEISSNEIVGAKIFAPVAAEVMINVRIERALVTMRAVCRRCSIAAAAAAVAVQRDS